MNGAVAKGAAAPIIQKEFDMWKHMLRTAIPVLALGSAMAQGFDPRYDLSFNGTDDHAWFSTDPGVPGAGFTLAAWVKPGPPRNTDQVLMSAGQTASGLTGWTLLLSDRSNSLTLEYTDSSGVSYSFVGPAIPQGEWHHVAATRAVGSASVELYVDGTSVLQVPTTRQPYVPTSTDVSVGCRIQSSRNGPVPGLFFQGEMDEPSLWNRALDDREVGNLHTYGVDPAAANLASYWNLDDGEGEWAIDLGPQGTPLILGVSRTDTRGNPDWTISTAPTQCGAGNLCLNIEPEDPQTGDTVNFLTFDARPGSVQLLYMTSVNRNPAQLHLTTRIVGGDGTVLTTGPAPAAASGLTVGVQALGFSANGGRPRFCAPDFINFQ